MNLLEATPTAARAFERRRAFHQSIARKAIALKTSKANPIVTKVQPKSLEPEAFPAEPDPPQNPIPAQNPIPECLANRITFIQKIVCDNFGITLPEITASRREMKVVMARMVAMHLCKKLTSQSLVQIGRRFGGRDHTTVLHSCRRAEKIFTLDPSQSLSPQWTPEVCAFIRSKIEALKPVFLERFPEG